MAVWGLCLRVMNRKYAVSPLVVGVFVLGLVCGALSFSLPLGLLLPGLDLAGEHTASDDPAQGGERGVTVGQGEAVESMGVSRVCVCVCVRFYHNAATMHTSNAHIYTHSHK